MQRKDFWYNPEAESAGALPTGSRAGQFLFLSAQTPIDLETGYLVRTLDDLPPEGSKAVHHSVGVDAWFGAVRAQTWTIYQNLSKILKQQGSSLENIIQQRIYLPFTKDTRHVEQIMLSFFPGEKPTTMIVGVPDRGLQNGIHIWVEVTALIPEKGGLKKESIYLPELKSVTAPYPTAVKVGQFLFIGEMMGIDPKTGKVVTRLDELGPDASRFRTGYVRSDGSQERGKAQYWLQYKHFETVLKSQGGEFKDLLDLTGYWRYGMPEASDREELRKELFKSAEKAPPSTLFGINNLSVIPEVDVITGAIAMLPGQKKSEKMMPSGYSPVGTYAAWSKAEPFWFAAGAAGIDHVRKRSILSFGDIADKGRFLAQSRVDDNQFVMSKVWHLFHDRLFGALPYKPKAVLRQIVYLTNPSFWPAVERISSLVYDGRIPPTTIVPIDDVALSYRNTPTYELMAPECVEIQLMGLTEER